MAGITQWNADMVDIQPAEGNRWEIINTIGIDIGTDILNEEQITDSSGNPFPITGTGVTIAVVDSGVQVDEHIKNIINSSLYNPSQKQQFVGQYDFVGSADTSYCDKEGEFNSNEGYCFYDWDKSLDLYGHGAHVAGIVGSPIKDESTNFNMGIASGANVISIRVLGEDGVGTYEDVIEGIQWVVENQSSSDFEHPIRVMNLSLSARANLPYFVDPINRAVESAWAAGIVVLAAAGNEGPGAGTITVPGNDPYIITVGAINNQRTPGYWADDTIPNWSSTGPTADGFVKPDILAPGAHIVSLIDKGGNGNANLVDQFPGYFETDSLFRMNGTSMATAVASGVVALMLEADPTLTPDEVKYRLMCSAKPALVGGTELAYNIFQQGSGRIWAPDAVLGTDFPQNYTANNGLDIQSDLAHGWMLLDNDGNPVLDENGNPKADPDELLYHYQGGIRGVLSDDGDLLLYYMENDSQDDMVVLGAVQTNNMSWIDYDTMIEGGHTFSQAGENNSPWNTSQSGQAVHSPGAAARLPGAVARLPGVAPKALKAPRLIHPLGFMIIKILKTTSQHSCQSVWMVVKNTRTHKRIHPIKEPEASPGSFCVPTLFLVSNNRISNTSNK